MRHWLVRGLAVLSAAILIGACDQTPSSPPTAVPPTPTSLITRTPPPPTRTSAPTSTPEPSPTPAARVSVSVNTHCRSGPATEYPSLGVLQVGEMAEVVGQGPEPGHWFITGAGLPEAGCWLWGEFAQVEGEVGPLPVFTPAPSPTPEVGFLLYLKSFEHCGDELYVVFAVTNVGAKRFWSGYIQVQDFTTQEMLHDRRERHPFADSVLPVCPPGHGNSLFPGDTHYIHAPLSHFQPGSTAIGIITLCTEDYQGGTCKTEYSYFELP